MNGERSRSSSLSNLTPPPTWDEPLEYAIRFPRSDGQVTRRPAKLDPTPLPDGTIDYHKPIEPDHPKHIHWRKAIGKHIAEHVMKRDVNQPWIIEDFPAGYQFYIHYKGLPDNPRQDGYLFGSRRVDKFRSPNEFYLHAQWLFFNEDMTAVPCKCKWCGKTDQGEINRIFGGTYRDNSTPRAPRPAKPPKPPRVAKPVPNRAHPAAPLESSPRTPSPPRSRQPVSSARNLDLRMTHKPRSREGDLVWCSLPSSVDGPEGWQKIEFWPGIITDNRIVVKFALGQEPPFTSQQHDVCTVRLLASPQDVTLAEEEILPYYAYAVPGRLRDFLFTQTNPPQPFSHGLPEIGVAPFPANGPLAVTSIRSFDEVWPSYVLALRMCDLIVRTWCLSDEYSCHPQHAFAETPGSSQMSALRTPESQSKHGAGSPSDDAHKRFQGLWWGPERIWLDDLVRLRIRWKDVPYELAPSNSGRNGNSPVFMRIDSIWRPHPEESIQTERWPLCAGQLFELVEASDPVPEVPNDVKGVHGDPPGSSNINPFEAVPIMNAPIASVNVLSSPPIPPSAISGKIPTYPLPPAPAGYIFVPLLQEAQRLEASLGAIAGRYHAVLSKSQLLAKVQQAGRTAVPDEDLQSLMGLHEAGGEVMVILETWVTGRVSAFTGAESRARAELSAAWKIEPPAEPDAMDVDVEMIPEHPGQ